MSTVKTVTDGSFRADVLENAKPVLVEFWANWCPPCRQLAPVLDAIAAEHGGSIDVVRVNIDENPLVNRERQILQVPTLHLFSGGQVVKEVIGARSKSALLREFADYLPA